MRIVELIMLYVIIAYKYLVSYLKYKYLRYKCFNV